MKEQHIAVKLLIENTSRYAGGTKLKTDMNIIEAAAKDIATRKDLLNLNLNVDNALKDVDKNVILWIKSLEATLKNIDHFLAEVQAKYPKAA